MEFPPIVSIEEMKRIEKEAFQNGVSLEKVMEEVAKGISDWIDSFITQKKLPKKICVFAGKGNNGADSLWSLLFLARKGYDISIVLPFALEAICETSKKLLEQLKKEKAKVLSPQEFKKDSFPIIIDGLLGIGVERGVKEPLLSAIALINETKKEAKSIVISIDTPSGLHEDFTEDECTVLADYTLFASLPKRCFFEKAAWEKVGTLIEIQTPSFEPYYPKHKTQEYLIPEYLIVERCLDHSIRERRDQNKYEAGYLLLVAGSIGMKGAAKLTAEAAYRVGCGIIRIFGFPLDLAEVITDERKKERFEAELARASCVCMGPGLGFDADTKQFFKDCLEACKQKASVPVILDADALVMLKEESLSPPSHAILTPHYGELLKLLGQEKTTRPKEVFEKALQYAKQHQIILICKGSPTRIFSPDGSCYISAEGDPAMATAGMGDVLSGVLAGLLCRGIKPLDAAIMGVYLHGKASLDSLDKWGLFHLLASDCIKELSNTISKFFHKR